MFFYLDAEDLIQRGPDSGPDFLLFCLAIWHHAYHMCVCVLASNVSQWVRDAIGLGLAFCIIMMNLEC